MNNTVSVYKCDPGAQNQLYESIFWGFKIYASSESSNKSYLLW